LDDTRNFAYIKKILMEGAVANASPKGNGDEQPRVGALIRARRKQQHMTLQALGAKAELSVGYLSQLERDHATPSLATLVQIARALGVGVDYFISTPSAEDALTRADGRKQFSINGSSIIYERLSAEFPGNTLSSFIMTVPPGYKSETVSHEGEEMLYVLDGAITQRLGDQEMIMSVGDSLHFRGNQPHSWSNHTDTPARLLWTGTLMLFRSIDAAKVLPDAEQKPASKRVRTPSKTKSQLKEKQS
jgi:transcriptional regulator with XRE-family HTH domain